MRNQKNEITPIQWIRDCIVGELKNNGSASLVLTMGTYDARQHSVLSLDEMNLILKEIDGALIRTDKDIVLSVTKNNNYAMSRCVLNQNDYSFLCQQYTNLF